MRLKSLEKGKKKSYYVCDKCKTVIEGNFYQIIIRQAGQNKSEKLRDYCAICANELSIDTLKGNENEKRI